MKLIKILLISFILIITLSNNSFAVSIDNVIDIGEGWESLGVSKANIGLSSTKLKEGSADLYNLLLVVATAVAIIVGTMMGVKYMTAGIDEKVKVKESLFPYLISCVVVFGSLGIWKLVVSILTNI